MARYGSANVGFVLIGGYNLLGVSTEISDTSEVGIEDTTALGDAWEESTVTGLARFELTQTGFYDDAAGSSHLALVGSNGVARVAAFAYEGNTIGKRFVGFAGPLQAAYTRVAKGKELHKANATYRGSGSLQNGHILEPLETITVSGSTQLTPVDNGAATANGGTAYLVLNDLVLGGATDITLRVRHSADNVTYVLLGSAEAVLTTAPQALRIAVTGTVDRYLAGVWLFTAGTSARVFIGFVRNP